MTSTEAAWSSRVAEWKASGKTVEEFAAGESYAPSTLRWWSSRLRRRVEAKRAKSTSVAMVRVVRASEVRREGVVVEVGLARIVIGEGFDPALLARVVAALSEPKMIPSGVQVFVALEPVDMRYSFDRLAGAAKEQVGYDARGGALFVFYGRRRDALKVLFFDGTGMCIFYKRLDRGTFKLPERLDARDKHVEIDDAALDALLDGIEVEEPKKRAVH